jgi:MscS family membrane protein
MDLIFEYLTNDKWWVIQVFLVVFATISINFIVKLILAKLEIQATRTDNMWDESLIKAGSKPINVMIWLFGISFAATIAEKQAHSDLFKIIPSVREIGTIIIITWFLIRFIKQLEVNYSQKNQRTQEGMDATTLTALTNLAKISIVITSVLVAIQSLGFSVSGVLAFGGIGGIAIGFAAKDMLANLFGSLIIFLDRPFKIGDWIRSPDRQIEGIVENIGWRMTVIRTFSKNPIYVPNSVFSTIAIENPSRMTNRRIHETVGIRYQDFSVLASIVKDVKQLLLDHPEIDTDQTLIVNFNKYGASSLDFFIYTFTKTTVWVEFHKVKEDILIKIGEIIQKHGAEIAFPTSKVFLEKVDAGDK